MTSKTSAPTPRARCAVAACLWMSVTLAGCSGGEEYLWPWQDEEPPAPAADLAGMWDYDPTKGFPDEGGGGFLFIEEPCVYMVEDINDPHNPLRRVVVRLPKNYARYDPQTQSIWVFTNGPFTTTDKVATGGNYNSPQYSGTDSEELYATCPARGQFKVKHMN